jgi:hypothetical protein
MRQTLLPTRISLLSTALSSTGWRRRRHFGSGLAALDPFVVKLNDHGLELDTPL